MFKDVALQEAELTSAVQVLRELFPGDELNQFQPSGPGTVYTTMVTLWMLTLQRLGGGKSLDAVVKDVLADHRGLLPQNRRLEEGTLSENSGAYSRARTRLETSTVEMFANRVSDSLIEASPPWFDGRRAFIIDGTTITLAPTEELKAAFPPATNQFGETVWPVAMLMVAHELQSGCALTPEVGAMYGEHNTSEAKLARQIAARIPRDSLVLADAGFGIFSVAWHMVQAGQVILFRLSKQRFHALRRQATLLEQTPHTSMYQLTWTPTRKERQTNPELPPDAALPVVLHEVQIGEESLYLITTLPVPSKKAGEYYARRYDVEHDIRDVKVTLATERIRARSVAMFRKELLTSIVAYNLVIQFRRQAAKIANIPPRRLSFTKVWNTFRSFLLYRNPCSPSECSARYDDALRRAARDKLPNRPGRSFPRRAHPRRPKSTKFMLAQARTAKNKPPDTPK